MKKIVLLSACLLLFSAGIAGAQIVQGTNGSGGGGGQLAVNTTSGVTSIALPATSTGSVLAGQLCLFYDADSTFQTNSLTVTSSTGNFNTNGTASAGSNAEGGFFDLLSRGATGGWTVLGVR